VRRDFVEDHRAEEPVQRLQDFAIAFGGALVQIGMIAQVDFRELLERNVRLPADAVTPVEDPWAFARFDVLRLQEALRAIEDEIARLEIAREGLVHEVSDRDEPQSGRRFTPDRSEPDRSDDLIQER
jgi:hypothetical protein